MATKTKASQAASLLGKRSVAARRKKWGDAGFIEKMREVGEKGGRPKGSGKKQKGSK